MSPTEYQRINVPWNNTFRHIVNCWWRKSTSSLQYCCNCLSELYHWL